MEYKKYQHVERYGTDATKGILNGKVYIYPKIDGTNGVVWLGNDDKVHAGSRNYDLSLEDDNANFYNTIIKDDRIYSYLKAHPTHRLFGEWLVPHSIKYYDTNAYNKFYIFDVRNEVDMENANHELLSRIPYLTYEEYAPLLEEFKLDYIPPLKVLENPTLDDITKLLDENYYLISDKSKGLGEGIIIKNYNYKNTYGRIQWAKIVRTEHLGGLKRSKGKKNNTIDVLGTIEETIIRDYVTDAFLDKEKAKLCIDSEWSNSKIPQYMEIVWHELITEEIWNIVNKYKKPTIDFKYLNRLLIEKVKKHLKLI